MKNLIFLFLAFCVGGCASVPPRPLFVPDTQQTGRVLWVQPSGDRLIGDCIFSKEGNDRFALLLGKEAPLLSIFRSAQTVYVDGRMAGGRWSGTQENLVGIPAEWNRLLNAWAATAGFGDGKHELHTSEYRVQFEKRYGTLTGMQVRLAGNGGEFLVAFAH